MKYQLIGETVPAVEMKLNAGEGIFTQKGGMIWQDEGIEMQTNTNGGIMKGLGRMFAGESLFMNTYVAKKDNATIAFGSTVPGKIVPLTFDKTSSGIIAQKGAFLCAEKGIDLRTTFTKKFSEGLFLTKLVGPGKVILQTQNFFDFANKIAQLFPKGN